MLEIIELLTHYFITLVKHLKPGGVKLVMAESIAMKHQLIVMKTPRRMAEENSTDKNVVSLDHDRWISRCNGLYQLPVAA